MLLVLHKSKPAVFLLSCVDGPMCVPTSA
jgi:hypothetical protein